MMGAVEQERYVQRRITDEFIAADPSTIVLTPRVATRTVAGGTTMVNGPDRPPQVFKLILASADTAGASVELTTEDSTERRKDFILFGRYDAYVNIGDHWVDHNGEEWEVTSILPSDGYSLKATVASYGRHPDAPLY